MDYFNEHDGDPEWDAGALVIGNVHYVEQLSVYADIAVRLAADRFLDIPTCEFVGRESGFDFEVRWWYRLDTLPPEGTIRSLRWECSACDWVSKTVFGWVGDETITTNDERQAQYREVANHPFEKGWSHEPRLVDVVAHPGAEHIFNRAGGTRCVCGERVPSGD